MRFKRQLHESKSIHIKNGGVFKCIVTLICLSATQNFRSRQFHRKAHEVYSSNQNLFASAVYSTFCFKARQLSSQLDYEEGSSW